MGPGRLLELRDPRRHRRSYGYPPLTGEAKRKILGENLLRLQSMDVEETSRKLVKLTRPELLEHLPDPVYGPTPLNVSTRRRKGRRDRTFLHHPLFLLARTLRFPRSRNHRNPNQDYDTMDTNESSRPW